MMAFTSFSSDYRWRKKSKVLSQNFKFLRARVKIPVNCDTKLIRNVFSIFVKSQYESLKTFAVPQAYTTFIIMRGGKFVQLFFSARLFLHLFLVFHYLSRSMLYFASRFLSSHLAWTLNSSVAVTLHSLGDFQTLENGRIRNCQTRNYRHQTWKWMAYATVPVRSLQPPLNIAVISL